MSEWYNRQKKPSSNFRKLLLERSDKTGNTTTDDTKRHRTNGPHSYSPTTTVNQSTNQLMNV